MKLLKQPDGHSCCLYAFAMALDVDPEWIEHQIGHNGSEQAAPGYMPRGFHTQEMYDVCLHAGYAPVYIEAMPVSRVPTLMGNYEKGIDFEIKFKEGNLPRFWDRIKDTPGVLFGQTPRFCHWVAWSGFRIFDPRGMCYPIWESPKFDFTVQSATLIFKIN